MQPGLVLGRIANEANEATDVAQHASDGTCNDRNTLILDEESRVEEREVHRKMYLVDSKRLDLVSTLVPLRWGRGGPCGEPTPAPRAIENRSPVGFIARTSPEGSSVAPRSVP